MAYDILTVDGDYVEACDECGFNGGVLTPADVDRRLRSLADAWGAVLAADVEVARARPEPGTWCGVEYSLHTAFVLDANRWAAERFVAGEPVAWNQMPSEIEPVVEFPQHDCGTVAIDAASDRVARAALALAGFTTTVTAADLRREAKFGGGRVLNAFAVVRHALHDAEHHLLDVRRGIAKLLLARAPSD